MRVIKVALTAAWLCLALTTAAHAEPITIALFGAAWVAANATAAALVTAVITIGINLAIGYGVSLLKGAKKQAPAERSGVKLQMDVGETSPIAFTVGITATAGTLKYVGSWGNAGETPNAYVTEVIQIGDIPGSGLDGFIAYGTRCTILAGEVAQGFPVEEFRDDAGVDYMWVRYFDGSQTVADPFLVATFGSHPTRPWLSTMIGRGLPYVTVTRLVNDEGFFSGSSGYLFEPAPTAWYDLRLDSTNGGSGAHRWGDQSTYEPSSNPVVLIYNIIRGVSYGDEWVYGGQGLAAFRLPSSSWMAAANECDVPIDIAGGGSEPQFRCGMEIAGDLEPLSAIEELKKSCNGRIAEIGGRFEILVGAPGAAVYSFSDDDIVVTKEQGFEPFPPLAQTVNALEATYPEPSQLWTTTSAPPRYSSTLEAEDGGRRLPETVSYATVPFGLQVQRLMKATIEEERRFRVHVIGLPPSSWVLTPNSVVSWSSVRNGYVNKKFIVVRITGALGMIQTVVLKEIDPTDYSWTIDDEIETDLPSLVIVRPPPQAMTGWAVSPYTFPGDDGSPRRPGILVEWAGGMVAIRAVRIQVREDFGDNNVVFDGEVTYDKTEADPAKAIGGHWTLPDTDYEVRGIFLPFDGSGRPMEWSDWLGVTTPNVRLSGEDFYPGFDLLTPEVRASLEWLSRTQSQHRDDLHSVVVAFFDARLNDIDNLRQLRSEIAVQRGTDTASYESLVTTAVGEINGYVNAVSQRVETLDVVVSDPDTGVVARGAILDALSLEVHDGVTGLSAIGTALTLVEVEVGQVSASGGWKVEVTASPGGGYSQVGMFAKASDGSFSSSAALLLRAHPTLGSLAALKGTRTVVLDASDNPLALFDVTGAYFANARIHDLDATNITAAKIDAALILQNGTTITALIAANQITLINYDTESSTVNITNGSPSIPSAYQTICSLSQTSDGGAVWLVAVGRVYARVADAGGNSYGTVTVELQKDGVTVFSDQAFYDEAGLTHPQDGQYVISYVDPSPSAGAHTWSTRARLTAGPGFWATIRAGSTLVPFNGKR